MTIGLFNVLLQKPRLNVTENAHLTTRMRTGGGVYFFHGLLILRYSATLGLNTSTLVFHEPSMLLRSGYRPISSASPVVLVPVPHPFWPPPTTTKKKRVSTVRILEKKNWSAAELRSCRNPGSNRGPLDLQSNALPTELFRLTKDCILKLILYY